MKTHLIVDFSKFYNKVRANLKINKILLAQSKALNDFYTKKRLIQLQNHACSKWNSPSKESKYRFLLQNFDQLVEQ